MAFGLMAQDVRFFADGLLRSLPIGQFAMLDRSGCAAPHPRLKLGWTLGLPGHADSGWDPSWRIALVACCCDPALSGLSWAAWRRTSCSARLSRWWGLLSALLPPGRCSGTDQRSRRKLTAGPPVAAGSPQPSAWEQPGNCCAGGPVNSARCRSGLGGQRRSPTGPHSAPAFHRIPAPTCLLAEPPSEELVWALDLGDRPLRLLGLRLDRLFHPCCSALALSAPGCRKGIPDLLRSLATRGVNLAQPFGLRGALDRLAVENACWPTCCCGRAGRRKP